MTAMSLAFGDRRIPVAFWNRASPEPNTGCWLREGTKIAVAKARRRAYVVLVAPIPAKHLIEPLCGLSCVNPRHTRCLRIRTQDEKLRDKRYSRARKTDEDRCDIWLRSRYNITIDDYNRMLAAQNNSCVICGMVFCAFGEERTRRPQVDHCHATGMVRGLLCIGCNTGVGNFKESPTLMSAAIGYLARKPGPEPAP